MSGLAADAGRITKYVYPDGRVVYSDKPVPGARAEREILVEKAPTAQVQPASDGPATAGPAAPTTEPPASGPGSESLGPVVAEAWDGRCHMVVTGEGQVFAVHVSGLVPGEPLEVESTSDGETLRGSRVARSDGTFGGALFPAVLGKSSGIEAFTVTTARCRVSVSFHWNTLP